MLAHPGANTLAADDAALLLYLTAIQWEPLEIEHVAERATSFSASATEALNNIGRKKDLGRPVDTETHALVAYLTGIERKYTGRQSRFTVALNTGEFGGQFFQLVKIFFEAGEAVQNEAPPSDAKIKGLLDRCCPPK